MAVMIESRWGFVMSDNDKKMTTSELSDNELMRYARQILLNDWDMDAQLRLKSSRVLIVGVGGLGCPVLQILARAGVGSMHLIDFDVVSCSNLQRQTLFRESDVGQPKVVVASRALAMHNEFIDITHQDVELNADNITAIIGGSGADLVIDCTDNLTSRYLINQTCRTLGLPLLSNSAIGEVGQIALFDKQTGCYECLFGQDKDDNSSITQNCATSGVLSSTVSIIGSMSAQIALDYLGRGHNPIAHELLLWQGRTMTLQKMRFATNKYCPLCHA